MHVHTQLAHTYVNTNANNVYLCMLSVVCACIFIIRTTNFTTKNIAYTSLCFTQFNERGVCECDVRSPVRHGLPSFAQWDLRHSEYACRDAADEESRCWSD